MTDRGVMIEETSATPAPSPAALEQRVRRLEDVVANLQDTQQIEERIVERVSDRITRHPVPVPRESAPVLVEAGRRLLPTAIELMRTQDNGPRNPAAPTRHDTSAPWLFLDFASELRSFVRMILDPHYRLTWLARAVLFGVLPFIIVSSFLIPGTGIPIFGTILDKVIVIVLAFLAYKILCRELGLYRQAVADLPPRYRSGR